MTLLIDECLRRVSPAIQDGVDAVQTDNGPPYLLYDLYPLDRGPLPNFSEADGTDADADGDADIVGGILKATDGIAYGYTNWFITNWKRLKGLRGAYHFLQFLRDPIKQADFYISTVELAGGFDDSSIMPIVDVELGGERAPNRRASAQQVIDCTSAWAARVKEITGRRVMLYGRGAMRDLLINDRMGCDCVWNPSYTQTMVLNGIASVGGRPGPWTLDDVVLWQYGGDGVGDNSVTKLPLSIDGLGAIDMSVAVNGSNKSTMATVRARLI